MYIDVNLLIKEGRSHYSCDAPEEYNSRIKEQHDGPLLKIILFLSNNSSPRLHSMCHWTWRLAVDGFIFIFLSQGTIPLTQTGIWANYRLVSEMAVYSNEATFLFLFKHFQKRDEGLWRAGWGWREYFQSVVNIFSHLKKKKFTIFQNTAVDVQSARFLYFWLYIVSVIVQALCIIF